CVSIRVSALLLLHMLSVIFFIFFFSSRRRHTRSKRDWSSDVCSSDLPLYSTIMATVCGIIRMVLMGIPPLALTGAVFGALLAGEIGRASCRERGKWWGVAGGAVSTHARSQG